MGQKFISECPLLEELFLSLCLHCKRIRVSHAPKLKILTVKGSSSSFCNYGSIFCDVESIEIVAPSLQQCTLIDVDGSVIDMVGCADLKYFNLTGVKILVQEFHKLISKFPLLEKLIVNCYVLESISLSSNRLKELKILHFYSRLLCCCSGVYSLSEFTDLKITEDQIVVMDRISELPDVIIHHIMSYLSTLEATQTCVLSKRWNHLQTSFPILDFDLIYFEEKDLETRRKKRKIYNINKFIQFVDASLLPFCEAKVSMQKFRLSMKVYDAERVASHLEKWIELAVANEVKELDLNVETIGDRRYSPPETIFSAEFVTTLKLGGCNLEQSSAYTIRFHFLKKLVLNAVHIDEQAFQKFISECPLLEDLFLSLCWHCKCISVSHAPKLKILTVNASPSSNFCDDNLFGEVESIEIVVPSLQQCTLIDFHRSFVIDMVGCADLKYFNLTSVKILVQKLHNLISKLPLLEKLILKDCVLERVSLSSNRLKELQIICCPRFKGCLEKFKNFSLSLPREVGNLTIEVLALPPSDYAALLDCLLCICYPKILSIKPYNGQSSIEFIMWLYEKMTKRDAKCCNGHGIKYWHNYLKDFKIESFIPLNDPNLFI
ncbi:hypothetical protein LWI29_028014 [Acer saccharum]|uniref:F-box domain-containing protein n=1 Tax=Acer saccharum TaxID=4024 RepID=A0AA39SNE5_ACESA|nr:hypothetical protein LWI29_028014 [Acer saccharum]